MSSTHAWPDNVECRLRIGLHRGEPTLTDNGYVGLVVNTAARVCSAAHGRQILVTEAVRSAAVDSETAGIGFRSLGRYRLRGLPTEEALYQVEADGLQAEFPPPTPMGRI
jgi:class 3 adenylate cyclase